MIAISDNPISQYYKEYVTPSWEERGFQINHFEAVVPADLEKDCNFIKFKMKHSFARGTDVEFTPTEKAVWYSHYMLWKKCWDTQKHLIVVEHDILLLQDLEPEIFSHDIACLSHDLRGLETKEGNKVYRQLQLAGGCYYLKPNIAREMMRIRHEKKVIYNSDAWIHRTCDKFGRWYKHKCRQFKNENVGVTIEHNKV